MIAMKNLTILHFEDDRTTQKIVKDRLTREGFPFDLISESTFFNAAAYLKSPLTSNIDLIISDCMMPSLSAFEVLEDLSNSGVMVIFYSCIDEIDFYERCMKILGMIPGNFRFVMKASIGNLDKLIELIKEEVE